MGVIKRKSEILGLKNLDVLIEDTAFESTYFQILECPSILTQGKSSFLIGGSDKLKTGVEVKVEIVNNETNEVDPNMIYEDDTVQEVVKEVVEDEKDEKDVEEVDEVEEVDQLYTSLFMDQHQT